MRFGRMRFSVPILVSGLSENTTDSSLLRATCRDVNSRLSLDSCYILRKPLAKAPFCLVRWLQTPLAILSTNKVLEDVVQRIGRWAIGQVLFYSAHCPEPRIIRVILLNQWVSRNNQQLGLFLSIYQ